MPTGLSIPTYTSSELKTFLIKIVDIITSLLPADSAVQASPSDIKRLAEIKVLFKLLDERILTQLAPDSSRWSAAWNCKSALLPFWRAVDRLTMNLGVKKQQAFDTPLMSLLGEVIQPFLDSTLSFKFVFLLGIELVQLLDGENKLPLDTAFAQFFPFALLNDIPKVKYNARVLSITKEKTTHPIPIDSLAHVFFTVLVKCLNNYYLLHKTDDSLRQFFEIESSKIRPDLVKEKVLALINAARADAIVNLPAVIRAAPPIANAVVDVINSIPSSVPIPEATDVVVIAARHSLTYQQLLDNITTVCEGRAAHVSLPQVEQLQVKLEHYRQQLRSLDGDSNRAILEASLHDLEQSYVHLLTEHIQPWQVTNSSQLQVLSTRLQENLNSALRDRNSALLELQREKDACMSSLYNTYDEECIIVDAKLLAVGLPLPTPSQGESTLSPHDPGEGRRQALARVRVALVILKDNEKQLCEKLAGMLASKQYSRQDIDSCIVNTERRIAFLDAESTRLQRETIIDERDLRDKNARLARLSTFLLKVQQTVRDSRSTRFILEKHYHTFLGDAMLIDDPAVQKCMHPSKIAAATTWKIDKNFAASLERDIQRLQQEITVQQSKHLMHKELHAELSDYLNQFNRAQSAIIAMQEQFVLAERQAAVAVDVVTADDMVTQLQGQRSQDSDASDVEIIAEHRQIMSYKRHMQEQLVVQQQSIESEYARACQSITAIYQTRLRAIQDDLDTTVDPMRMNSQVLQDAVSSLQGKSFKIVDLGTKRCNLLFPMQKQLREYLGVRKLLLADGTDLIDRLRDYIINDLDFSGLSKELAAKVAQHSLESALTSQLSAIIAAMIDCEYLSRHTQQAGAAQLAVASVLLPHNTAIDNVCQQLNNSIITLLGRLPGEGDNEIQGQLNIKLNIITQNFKERKYAVDVTQPITKQEYDIFKLHFFATLRSYDAQLGQDRKIWQFILTGFLAVFNRAAQLMFGTPSNVDPLSIKARHPFFPTASWMTMTKSEYSVLKLEERVEEVQNLVTSAASAA